MIQAHIFFSGTVQGIGFRYTVRQVAKESGLTGWVRNLSDGRVEMVAEGPQEKVEQAIRDIEDHFDGYIRSKDVRFEKSSDRHQEFKITF